MIPMGVSSRAVSLTRPTRFQGFQTKDVERRFETHLATDPYAVALLVEDMAHYQSLKYYYQNTKNNPEKAAESQKTLARLEALFLKGIEWARTHRWPHVIQEMDRVLSTDPYMAKFPHQTFMKTYLASSSIAQALEEAKNELKRPVTT